MTQPNKKTVVAGSECEYVRNVDALAKHVLDRDAWPADEEQCDRISQSVNDSEWITWYWRQHKVLEHTQHLEAYPEYAPLQFDSVQSALTEFARAAMEADVLEAVGRLEGAMDEPTSGRKSNSPEEVSDDQDRDEPDQFGRLTESALNEDPDLDPKDIQND